MIMDLSHEKVWLCGNTNFHNCSILWRSWNSFGKVFTRKDFYIIKLALNSRYIKQCTLWLIKKCRAKSDFRAMSCILRLITASTKELISCFWWTPEFASESKYFLAHSLMSHWRLVTISYMFELGKSLHHYLTKQPDHGS